jgi:hypothetical protein
MSDGVYGDPFPIGDVTGDNIDDFALICQAPYGIGYPVWIFKGDRQYRLAGVQTGVNGPSPTFHLYPNPVTSFDARRVYLQGTLGLPSQLEIEVYDILGRSIFHISRRFDSAGAFQVPIEIGNVKPGSYFVSIDDGENRCVRSLVILSH